MIVCAPLQDMRNTVSEGKTLWIISSTRIAVWKHQVPVPRLSDRNKRFYKYLSFDDDLQIVMRKMKENECHRRPHFVWQLCNYNRSNVTEAELCKDGGDPEAWATGVLAKDKHYNHFVRSNEPIYQLHRLVFDEVQEIRGRTGKASMVVQRLSRMSLNFWGLSGTLFWNSLADLYVPSVLTGCCEPDGLPKWEKEVIVSRLGLSPCLLQPGPTLKLATVQGTIEGP